VSGSVSPYVTLDSSNNTDVNVQYHDSRAFTTDSRPDWYFESITQMCWNARVGYVGYTLKELKNTANNLFAVLGWASSPEPAKPGLFKPGLSPALMWA
jgi:hypothetical protein